MIRYPFLIYFSVVSLFISCILSIYCSVFPFSYLIPPSLLTLLYFSAKYNSFSFPTNLKEKIYFCRNFRSKAFESPSLVVSPPVHFLFLLAVFFKFPTGPLSHRPSYTILLFRLTWRPLEIACWNNVLN